ncbi:MAG: hypothetical protein ACM3KE_00475 [Hyphomicrobiales bacterium]
MARVDAAEHRRDPVENMGELLHFVDGPILFGIGVGLLPECGQLAGFFDKLLDRPENETYQCKSRGEREYTDGDDQPEHPRGRIDFLFETVLGQPEGQQS